MVDYKTIIGESTIVKGNLVGEESLNVQGRVEGKIKLNNTLFIEESGVVFADAEVREAIISGIMIGNIKADNIIHITPGGKMIGDITSPTVVIVDGASFKGNIDMGDVDSKWQPDTEKKDDKSKSFFTTLKPSPFMAKNRIPVIKRDTPIPSTKPPFNAPVTKPVQPVIKQERIITPIQQKQPIQPRIIKTPTTTLPPKVSGTISEPGASDKVVDSVKDKKEPEIKNEKKGVEIPQIKPHKKRLIVKKSKSSDDDK